MIPNRIQYDSAKFEMLLNDRLKRAISYQEFLDCIEILPDKEPDLIFDEAEETYKNYFQKN